jgi:serine protease Do
MSHLSARSARRACVIMAHVTRARRVVFASAGRFAILRPTKANRKLEVATKMNMHKSHGHLALALTIIALVCNTAGAAESIDRGERMKDLSKRIPALNKDGKLAEPKELISQLKRKRCDVHLEKAAKGRLSPAELYELRRNSVLMVCSTYKCGKCDKWHVSAASGFVVTKDGVALTNYHVVESKTNQAMAAVTYDGKIYPVTEILAASKEDDIAVLKLGGTDFEHVSLSTEAPVGTDVWVISHPGDSLYLFTEGMVSSYFSRKRTKHSKKASEWMGITADFGKGSSGAPIFNESGNVIGMVSSTSAVLSDKHGDHKGYAQMVVKQCVTSEAILKLFK